jgi:hypothetical protein
MGGGTQPEPGDVPLSEWERNPQISIRNKIFLKKNE